jgi:two-component system sensor histidine kinase KdpD
MPAHSRTQSRGIGIVVSVIAVAAVTLLIYTLREVMPVAAAGVLYLLPVLLASSYWGLALGAGTALLSAAAFNFFHIPPTGRFTIADEQNWVALAVFLLVAGVTSTLAGAARARAEEAEGRRREADLTAEMARVLLGGENLEDSLRIVGHRIAQALDLPWVEVELGWTDSDARRRALPIVVEGQRAGTVAVPRETEPGIVEVLERRLVPALEILLTAARRREGLEAQVIETRALRRSNVVKTALLRSVSHDLRSPLTAIAAAAGGLSSQTLDDPARAELLSVIEDESERLTTLVDNLLDLSKLQAGQLELRADWASAEELVEAALATARVPEGGFEVAFDPDLPMFKADAAQIERAIANLVENAVRHAGAEPVTITAQPIGGELVIRVSDRGPGIAREELERIFEPFHTADEGGQGSGLGLAIARGFVEANGGSLRAQSLPGQGATFVIRLPLSEVASAT